MPRQSLLIELFHERIRIKFFYIVYTRTLPFAFEEHHGTGVPAMIGAKLFMQGIWKKPGVWNVEEFNPDPFMKELNEQGLPWHELFNIDLEL